MFQRLIPQLFSLVSLFLIGHLAHAQSSDGASVFGSVRSTSDEALPGTAISIENTQYGVATDANGHYVLSNIPAGEYILTASFIGYQTQRKKLVLTAGSRVEVDFQLTENSYEMGQVDVVGESQSTTINKQAFNVAALEVKDFHNTSSEVKHIMNRVPGVRILEEGGMGSDFNFTLNGFSGQQVKFFMDGIPMDNFGSSFNLNNIPVNMLDRVEVYKGVVPVWLGTDALGGAVNLITTKNPNFLDASYSFGSFNTHRSSVNAAYTNPKNGFTTQLNLSHNYSDNNYKVFVPIQRNNDAGDSAEVERFHDRYRSGAVRLQTGLVNRKYADQLLLGILASKNDKQVQTGFTMGSVYGAMTTASQSLVPTLRYSKKNAFVKGLDLSLYTAFNITEMETVDTTRGIRYNWLGEAIRTPGSQAAERSRTFLKLNDREFLTQANAGYRITEKHSLALNYAYSHLHRSTFDTENPDRPEHKFPQVLQKQVLGLAYHFEPSERWNATAFAKFYSMKAETHKQFDFALETERTEAVEQLKQNFGYGFATAYFITPHLQLKASYEHAYRMPDPREIFGDGLFVQYNPDLGPEQSDNFNLGANYSLRLNDQHRFSFQSGVIYRESQDLIYQVVKVASPNTSFGNLSNTRTMGVEGGFKYHWKNLLHAGANVTFQDITDQAEKVYNESYTNSGYQKNYQYGFRLPNTPYFFGNAHAGISFRDVVEKDSRLSFNYGFDYVEQYFLSWAELGSADSKKVIPRQAAHNVELSYSLQDGKYNISLECRNLTDERLYDKYFLQKPGRAFYVKLRFALGK